MIRDGKSSWLALDPSSLPAWATLNGIALHDVEVASGNQNASDDGNHGKGAGLVAKVDVDDSKDALVSVPREMVLSERRVRELASGDAIFAEILRYCAPFATTPRITILIFLLYQATLVNPNERFKVGVKTPFIEYLKFMPIPDLSTLYTEDELALFAGTTLIPATHAKHKKLLQEYQQLRKCTKQIQPLSQRWWGFREPGLDAIQEQLRKLGLNIPDEDENPLITLDDWILLDAFYRSRALEFPGEGEAMVPAVDMANHTVPANAEFEVNSDGGAVLQIKAGKVIKEGEEVFISYGDHKSPLEILFSYGFLPNYASLAGSILLSLPSPETDPLGPPKSHMVGKENCVPGIRVFEENETIKWDSEVLWLMILNEEDGLSFSVAHGDDGERELHMFWHDEEVRLRSFKELLEKDDMANLFKLRATVIVIQQLEDHMGFITDASTGSPPVEKDNPLYNLSLMAQQLRSMELTLVERARDDLLQEKQRLIETKAVQKYFDTISSKAQASPSDLQPVDGEEDDFT